MPSRRLGRAGRRRNVRALPRWWFEAPRSPRVCDPGLVKQVKRGEPDAAWSGPLRDALIGADRLEVWDLNVRDRALVLAITGVADLDELVGHLHLDGRDSGTGCMCLGTFALVFYRTSMEVARLHLHHANTLDWQRGPWSGFAQLTEPSKDALATWFAARGLAAIQTELDDNRRRDAAIAPEVMRAMIERRRAALDEVADPPRRLARICRFLGENRSPWVEPNADAVNKRSAYQDLTQDEFFAALELLGDDPAGLLGAARMLFQRRGDALPAELRGKWNARLLEAVLEHGIDADKPHALMMLWTDESPEVLDFLRRVAAGTTGREMIGRDEEPGIRAGAMAALAAHPQRDEGLAEQARALLAATDCDRDREALEATLALLGDESRLRAEHFAAQSWTIASAALHAVMRCNGRNGLDLLVEHALENPLPGFANGAVGVAAHVTGQPWVKQYSWNGTRDPRYATGVEAVRGWWKEDGAAFVAKQRGEG